MEIKFTLCFIKNGDRILMLFRQKPPNQFKWNGVGGKIEEGEDPTTACLREIKEETGLEVKDISLKGIVTWNDIGGMYVFIAHSETEQVVSSVEGKLEWKTLEWILHSGQVVSNIPIFLPPMLEEEGEILEYAFTYDDNEELIGYERK